MTRLNTVLTLITGLVFITGVRAAKQPTIDSSETEENRHSGFVDTDNYKQRNEILDEQPTVEDQISVLTRQLKMLTEQRQEDYRMLEKSLHSYVLKHFEEYINVDIKRELKDFRWVKVYPKCNVFSGNGCQGRKKVQWWWHRVTWESSYETGVWRRFKEIIEILSYSSSLHKIHTNGLTG